MKRNTAKIVCEMFREGKTYTDISKKLGIAESSARYKVMQNMGQSEIDQIRKDYPRRNTVLTDTQRQNIIDIYKAGKSIHATSVATGVSFTSVRRVVTKAGVIRTKPGKEADEAILKLYREGYSYRQIVKLLKRAMVTVSRVVRDHYTDEEIYDRKYGEVIRRDKEIYEKHAMGISQKDLAIEYGLNPNTVGTGIQRHHKRKRKELLNKIQKKV